MRKILSVTLACFILIVGYNHNIFGQEPIQIVCEEDFADGIFETLLTEKHIAGATFVMIKPGQDMIKKGYGFAQKEKNTSVNPEETLFRIGSISKLFIWFGVMQMVEQGKLDLDKDINEYLTNFKIPATYDQPVSLRSLMTHTAGFEDKLYKLFVRDPKELLPLIDVLKMQLPKQVRPPMTQAAYSNHGAGIAQHLVELASGMPFTEYSKRFIFEPLGMKNTTILQPLPEHLSNKMSGGYVFRDGIFVEQDFELIPLQSVGGASTTAHDMGLFIKAMLNNTCLNGHCLLDSASWEMMLTPAFSHAPNVNPATLGIMNISRNGRTVFGHGGNTFLFHSMLAILPEEQSGFFYSFNSEGGAQPSSTVLEYLIDHYFPDERPLMEPIQMSDESLEEFAGSYRTNRYSHSELFKILALMSSTEISPEEGVLKMKKMGHISRWVPVDSLTFRSLENNEIISFSRDENGKISQLFFGDLPYFALVKNHGLWNPKLHMILASLLLIVVLYILLGWPFIYLTRRKYVRADRASVTLPLGSKIAAWLTATCYAAFFLLFALGMPPDNEIVFGITPAIRTGLVFPLLAIPFTVTMIWQSIRLFDVNKIRVRSRLFYWLATLVFMAAVWQFGFWNLLGWRY